MSNETVNTTSGDGPELKETPCSVSFSSDFGEKRDGEYNRCKCCGSKVMLISAGPDWRVDQEPYANGEIVEHADGYVMVDAEVTAHYCEECERITSFSFHQS